MPTDYSRPMADIVEILSANEWEPETLERIAEVCRRAGFHIYPPGCCEMCGEPAGEGGALCPVHLAMANEHEFSAAYGNRHYCQVCGEHRRTHGELKS